ncbi:MAG: hypothetical protein E7554_04755 [Ruminococcaceae bacterium]|nr:hypothetical protein [Oscillospiraceae bacterium]
MAYNSGNNAYDLSLFEPRQTYVRATPKAEAGVSRQGKVGAGRSGAKSRTVTPERKAESRKERERRIARTRLVRILALSILAVIVITMLVSSRVDYHELTMEIESANKQLTELEQDYEALRVKFDTKMSDAAVEEYAVNTLGMQKRENSQTEYISLNVSNVFELSDQESDDWYQTNLEKILSYAD